MLGLARRTLPGENGNQDARLLWQVMTGAEPSLFAPTSKKSKKARRDAAASQGVVPTSGTFHYHPEEEFLEKVRAEYVRTTWPSDPVAKQQSYPRSLRRSTPTRSRRLKLVIPSRSAWSRGAGSS